MLVGGIARTGRRASRCYSPGVRRHIGAVMTAWAVMVALPAEAQDQGPCPGPPDPGVVESNPSVTARGVTIDAPMRVRYRPDGVFVNGPGATLNPADLIELYACPATVTEAEIGFVDCRVEGGAFVPGRAQFVGDELVFLPDETWIPNNAYTGVARGIDAGAGDFRLAFFTTSFRDQSPPMFGNPRLQELDSDRIEPRCDAPNGGFRVSTTFTPAEDDGSRGSIEYFLFQTRGTGIDEPVLRTRLRAFGANDRITMAFILPPDESAQVICLQVVAVDAVGNFDVTDVNDAACRDPDDGAFFEGLCSVRAPGHRRGPAGVALLFGLVAFTLLRRRSSASRG